MQGTFPCPRCGAQISIGQRFCGACGERFEYRCARCGAIVEALSKFCRNCGGGLHRETQLTEPLLERFRRTYQEGQRAKQKKIFLLSTGWLSACLGCAAIMLCIGAIFCAIGTGSQGESSIGLDGGFIFQGTLSASAPPPSMQADQKPVLVTDLPGYTADEVIMLAKSFTPDCRKKQTGWVGYNCPLYEDAEPIFAAEYLENGVWSVTKTCPINPEYDGFWYFYEDTGEFLESRR